MPSKAILSQLSSTSSLSVRALRRAAVGVSCYGNCLALPPFIQTFCSLSPVQNSSQSWYLYRCRDLASSFGKAVLVTAPLKVAHPDIDSSRQDYLRIYVPSSCLAAPSHHSPRVLPSKFGRWFLARAEGTSSMSEYLFVFVCFLFNDRRVRTIN